MYSLESKLLIFLTALHSVVGGEDHVVVTNDGPIVKGATITFNATVMKGNIIPSGSFKFFWQDNAIPGHSRTTNEQGPHDTWSVTYNADQYPFGTYIVQVTVQKCYMEVICYEYTSYRGYFYINNTLNGDLEIEQNNKTVKSIYISNALEAKETIKIKESDWNYIKNAPKIVSYWFVDCTYYGIMDGLDFKFNFTQAEEQHRIEALVMADFTPLPPTTTVAPLTTTTPKPNTTTTLSPTTVKPNSTSLSTINNTIVKIRNIRGLDRISNETQNITINLNGTLVPYNQSFPYVCNGSRIAVDKTKTYGYFSRSITVKAPVSKVNITGNSWLQHGELLTLRVRCQGSKDMQYCVQYHKGAYNTTGNETCHDKWSIDTCDFTVQRYLPDSMQHTIVIIIQNDVSKVVKQFTATIYDVKKQPQLSVIVVPVAFSLVTVVIVVFGVAYYIQNRSRFVVEVADFDFGQQYADMEYKTFRERLRDSILNAFSRGPTPSPSSSEVPVWPPGRKYGSMT